MNRYLDIAENELGEIEELLNTEFCDDGLVFYHLQNAIQALLKALALEYGIKAEDINSISQLIETIEKQTTVKFPEWIDQILEVEDMSVSDGCSTSICYDIDMYGDLLEAVEKLKEFVYEKVEQ